MKKLKLPVVLYKDKHTGHYTGGGIVGDRVAVWVDTTSKEVVLRTLKIEFERILKLQHREVGYIEADLDLPKMV